MCRRPGSPRPAPGPELGPALPQALADTPALGAGAHLGARRGPGGGGAPRLRARVLLGEEAPFRRTSLRAPCSGTAAASLSPWACWGGF